MVPTEDVMKMYACIFMDYIETEFFKTQYNTLFIEKIH